LELKKAKKKAQLFLRLIPAPSSHCVSTRAALTSVTGAPDFSRRALINWSWLEGGADEEEEAKDRERHRRRSSSSRDDDDDDNKELEETQRRQRKAELLLSFNAPEKEAEVET